MRPASKRLALVAALLTAALAVALVVPTAAQAAPRRHCVDGSRPGHLHVTFAADRSTVEVRARGRLCRPVRLVLASYAVPAHWDGRGFDRTSRPQRLAATDVGVLTGRRSLRLHVRVPCGNAAVALSYPPPPIAVGRHVPRRVIDKRIWHGRPCLPDGLPALRDRQSLEVTVVPGSLVLTTPYVPGRPLRIDRRTGGVGGLPTALASVDLQAIVITDTRAGTQPWTASAQATARWASGAPAQDPDVGLTGVRLVAGPPGAVLAFPSSLELVDSPAGSELARGLAGGPHAFASTMSGRGAVLLSGRLSVLDQPRGAGGLITVTITVV